jgi:hypothetical protein
MFRPFETVDDLSAASQTLRRRRYGVIEVVGGRLQAIHLRPLAKRVSWWQAKLLGPWLHARSAGDRCLLFYNQPWRQGVFLALPYAISGRETTLATIRRALAVLEDVARLKGTLAIVCDVTNARISDRLLRRWGWEPHAPMRWHRNFIKRLD